MTAYSKMTKTQKKQKAQKLIMHALAATGYYISDNNAGEVDGMTAQEIEEYTAIVSEQMDRVAKLFGYESAWFG